MHFKIFIIRKIKSLFCKFKLHVLFKPFEGILLNIVYLSRLSRWIAKTPRSEFNDFYNRKVIYQDRFKLHQYVIDREIKDQAIDYLEFGVARGIALKWWVEKNKNTSTRFYGFDVFTGSPEDFGVMKSYHFDTQGETPKINDERVSFIKGLFQDTLFNFLSGFNSNRKMVIHMDADLYSSTLFVLTAIFPRLKKDDIIIFDEFGVPTFEFRAFSDLVSAYNLEYELIGSINNYLQIAIKLK